jgi:hypothetical protein
MQVRPYTEGVPSENELGNRLASAIAFTGLDKKTIAEMADLSQSAMTRLTKHGIGMTATRVHLLSKVLAGEGQLTPDFKEVLLYLQGATNEIPLRTEDGRFQP